MSNLSANQRQNHNDKPLDDVSVHVALRPRLVRDRLQRRPIVQVPVCRDFDDFGWLDGAHGIHPRIRRVFDVRLNPGLGVVGSIVRLQIVMHERMIVHDPHFLQLPDQLLGRRPERRGVACGFLAAEFGDAIDRADQNISLLLGREIGDTLVSVPYPYIISVFRFEGPAASCFMVYTP